MQHVLLNRKICLDLVCFGSTVLSLVLCNSVLLCTGLLFFSFCLIWLCFVYVIKGNTSSAELYNGKPTKLIE